MSGRARRAAAGKAATPASVPQDRDAAARRWLTRLLRHGERTAGPVAPGCQGKKGNA
jgi:hypothetical protein